MARPGTQIISRDVPPPRSAPTNTGVWFVAGITEKGDAEPRLVRSMNEFEDVFGSRLSTSYLYDAAETYFREGGNRLYVSRVFGPTPVEASVVLDTAGAADALTVTAKSPGSWGNALSVAVTAGDTAGEFKVVVYYNDVVVETSPSLATAADAAAWAENSDYVDIEDEGNGDPATVAAQDLTSGTDDSSNATDATYEAALSRFTRDLGPGQVSYPGRTTTTAHADLMEHAAANNRIAILDGPNSASDSTLKTASASVRANANARYGAMFAPWVLVPGITGGTTRLVPPSAVVAGVIARNDGLFRSPNAPAAGELGQSNFVLSVEASWTDSARESLNDSNVNIIRSMYGNFRIYGWRTGVGSTGAQAKWLQLSNARLNMAIVAKADEIAERYVFAEIDGQGRKLSQFYGDLVAMLLDYYNAGSLYGQTPDDAFAVQVGPEVNPIEELAAGNLRATLAVRMSPFAELVTIEIVKVALTEAVA